MKANELMVGDWVSIKPLSGYVYTQRKIKIQDFATLHKMDFAPIPLTEEILQKNFPTPEEIVWWPLNDGSFRVEMQDDTHLIIGKYNYIHELQHALCLCGIEKSIEL